MPLPNEETITVTFDMDDGVKVETKGFEGKKCLEATEQLKKGLGLVTNETPTAEMKKVAQTSTAQVKTNVKPRN